MANDIIDINVYETVETVAITVNPNLTTININQVTGGGGSFTNLSTTQTASNFTINSDTGDDASVPLGNGTLAGATLNDYTTAEKNKLSGIATGAEVNVNADWNATSGDAQILNKPTIPSAQVNSDWNATSGVAQILNKPTISGTNTGDQNLQLVTNLGASTTNSITANSFVKSGGTSSEILAADGTVITAGTNITITGGQISSVGGAGGGGSSVNYYLNGGTSQGTFGGTTYYEFSKTAVIGTGADFSRGTNGYIASFITDVADPSLLLIPAGNWNLEFFFHSSSTGGSPSFYVELYKYDGTTFTLIASNSATPEGITNGTSIDAYFTPLAVPETILTVNDRLAIRVFVNASSKTITLHTQNGHLCEVITTFTAGLTALNGLQAQVQNFATGTTGTDFAINSSGSTHTFNLPSASATARGVVTTASQTFAGDKTFTGAIGASNLSGTNTGDNATNTQYSGLATSKQDVITLTTTGTSGAATLIGSTLNIPQYSGGGGGSGTVTSVAALTLGTTGTDLSSTVADGTTTPVITLNVPDASATNRGVLTAANFTIFNDKLASPTWVDYSSTSTVTGWSSFTTKVIKYIVIGKSLTINFNLSGTSNTTSGTFTVPFNNVSGGDVGVFNQGQNNGATALMRTNMANNSNVMSTTAYFSSINTGTAFTASGTKTIRGTLTYEIA